MWWLDVGRSESDLMLGRIESLRVRVGGLRQGDNLRNESGISRGPNGEMGLWRSGRHERPGKSAAGGKRGDKRVLKSEHLGPECVELGLLRDDGLLEIPDLPTCVSTGSTGTKKTQ